MTPAECGARIAAQWPMPTEAQVEAAARILASVEADEQVAA